METAQPAWATCSTAWQSSWWKTFSLYPIWASLNLDLMLSVILQPLHSVILISSLQVLEGSHLVPQSLVPFQGKQEPTACPHLWSSLHLHSCTTVAFSMAIQFISSSFCFFVFITDFCAQLSEGFSLLLTFHISPVITESIVVFFFFPKKTVAD